MKSLQHLFYGWSDALGWSLLHSLWQGLLITVAVVCILKCIPARSSRLRYIVCTFGLALQLITTIVTFSLLLKSEDSIQNIHALTLSAGNASQVQESGASLLHSLLGDAVHLIEANMNIILLGWIAGAAIFCLRIFSGWYYLVRIKQNATQLTNAWSEMLQRLASNLDIKQQILLAESAAVGSPMVIGYIKPIILVPVGLLSGLTTEQIETIFLHELAHIKRHDYLVNLLQSVVEALLFFNPFIWILSDIIRREREYCCDDAVVQKHGSPLAYARALAHLEEARLNRSVLALPLAENKNQLLNRIKRIMEKSVTSYPGPARIVPVLLVLVGLTCASWITLQAKEEPQNDQDAQATASDTTKRKNEKKAKRYRKKETITNDQGKPVEVITESFEGDEELRPLVEPMELIEPLEAIQPMQGIEPIPPMDFAVDIPAIPAFPEISMPDITIPVIDPIIMPVMPMTFPFDTTKRFNYQWRNENQWKEFNKEFEKEFRERFGDFYKQNGKDLNKMLDELSEKFQEKGNQEEWNVMQRQLMANQDNIRQQLNLTQAKLSEKALIAAQMQAELAAKDAHERAREWEQTSKKNIEEWSQNHQQWQQRQEEQLKKMEYKLRAMEENLHAFEKELKEQLVKDGYIGKDETIKNMQWDDSGRPEINGKKIKDSDRKKYLDLHRKYFKDKPGSFRFTE
jgi:bla regulator protein BlaR1